MCFQAHSSGCGQASSPHCLLVGDISSLPYGALQRVTGNMAAGSPQGKGKSRCSNRCHSLYVTLVLEETFHHFVPCSVHRGESLGLAPSRGEGITQTHKYQEVGIIEDHLGRLPQCPSCLFSVFLMTEVANLYLWNIRM